MVRSAIAVVAVLAAMSLGRVITETLPQAAEGAVAPYFRGGEVGQTVELEYADIEVTGIRTADQLAVLSDRVLPGGTFLIVDTRIRPRHDTTTFLGVHLLDRHGRLYLPTDRGSSCSTNTTAVAGIDWYEMWCFDVPERALEGARFVFARGAAGEDEASMRRDDAARVDLGIGAEAAKELWDAKDAYAAEYDGFNPLKKERLEVLE